MKTRALAPQRRRIVLVGTLTAALTLLLCCGGGVSVFFLGGLFDNDSDLFGFGCGSTALVNPDGTAPRVAGFEEGQIRNAGTIISVGQRMNVPPRGWVIAVATAMQESNLINLGHLGDRNDHDSLGLFQQRPSQGWGTPEQILDPEYASRKFYEKLLTVPNWTRLPLTDAAQSVQKSAYPDAYAKHERSATQIVNVLTDGAARASGDIFDLRCVLSGEVSASGWTVPLKGKIVSGFRPPSRPSHHGVDLAATKGTVIHAASAGIVVRVRCNARDSSGRDVSCDHDGSPSVRGCGWYVDILHPSDIMTRYCHMVTQPDVRIGQHVAAGQTIGKSGSSGHSSGPHLHFEVHLYGDQSSRGATDPDQFMRNVGAPLGDTQL